MQFFSVPESPLVSMEEIEAGSSPTYFHILVAVEDMEALIIFNIVDDEGHSPAGIQQVLPILCIMVACSNQVIRIPHALLLDILAEFCVAQKITAGAMEEAEDG